MSDSEIKQYKKDLEKWKKRVEGIHDKFDRDTKEDFKTIEIINQTIKEVKRRKEAQEQEIPVKPIDELIKDREKLLQNINNKAVARNFKIMEELPPKRPDDAPKFDVKGFMQQLIKKGGIPAGSKCTIKPEPGDEMKVTVECED